MPKAYNHKDPLMFKAHKEGFRARSVYKLQELDQKFHLLRPGMSVLDLGAAPGSWLQYISQKIGVNGQVIGIDLQPIDKIADNVTTITQDITKVETTNDQPSTNNQFDLIVSDAAPNTSGIPGSDHLKSLELCQAVVVWANKFLKPRGNLVVKIFAGAGLNQFSNSLQNHFNEVKLTKVSASRDRSKEMYIIALGRKSK